MSEVVLIEFIGDAKSGVAAANEQVAANERVAASTKGVGAASAAAVAPVGELGTATERTGKATKKSTGLFNEHGKITGKLGSIYGNTAKAAGGLLAAYAGFEALKGAVNFTENLVHQTQILTNVTGLDAKAASQWVELAKQRDIATTKLQIGFTTLSKQIRSAETGSTTAAKGFHALGIPLKELAHLKTEEVLLRVSKGLKETASYANRAALTQQFFGKSGRELLPILAQGAGALKKQLDKFSGLTAEQQKAGEEALEFKRKISRLYDELRIKVSFALLAAGKAVAKWVKEIDEGKTDVAKTIQGIGHILGPILQNYIAAAGQIFRGFAQLIKGVCETIQGITHAEFGKAWKGIENIFSGGVKAIIGIMHGILSPVIGIAKSLGVDLNHVFSNMWHGIEGVFKSGINSVISFLNDLIGAINVIPGVPDIGKIGEIGSGPSFSSRGEAHEKLGHQHRARGGSIYDGAPSGDTVPAMLERGEYVLNKKAVAKVGRGRLDAINFHEAPRFAFGGAIGEAVGSAASSVAELPGKAIGTLAGALAALPTPHLPKWLSGLGSYIINEVSDFITSGFQEKKFGSVKSPSSVSLQGVSGSVASQAAQIAKRAHSPQRATLALFEALWAESSMGTAAPGNVLEALEPYTKIRPAAQEISGFLTGHPTWTGTAAIPVARSTGLPAHAIAQLVQKSGVGEGNEGRANYLVQKGRALASMAQFGLAGGGHIPLQLKGGTGKAPLGQRFQEAAHRIWERAAPLYGRSRRTHMPTTYIGGTSRGESGETDQLHSGRKFVLIAKDAAESVVGEGHGNFGKSTLLHEWAHVFQNWHKIKKTWETEGGASAFAVYAGPKVFENLPVNVFNPPTKQYGEYLEHVIQQKGWPWVKHGQFKAKGGPVGMAAGGMANHGPPSRLRTLSPSEHGPATAESVVAWAKHFLGSGDRWGYPGEWCGAFVGADMLRHGIQPPSDYPLAAAWGKWGSAAAGPEFGNVVVIGGSGHVGIGLGGGKMISGNLSDSVAISTVAEAAGGRPVTGYRLPPYVSGGGGDGKRKPIVPKQLHGKFTTHHAGDTSKGGGTFAETGRATYNVQTAPLSFSSVPGSITGCRRELRERQRDLAEYKAAARAAKAGGTRKALEANVQKIRQRIKELIRAIGELIKKRKREHQVHKIEGHGFFPKIEEAIANRHRGYDEASEYAEQVVALEPETNPADYITGREGPAWQKVLNQESQWRNAILTGETVAATRLGSLEKQLHSVEGLRGSPAFNKQRWRIAPLKTAIASIKSVWSKNQHGVSGSFEEGLEGLQGPGKSHALMESLPTEPVAGSFGGLIFDTQMTIRELGLKLKQSTEGEDNSGLLEAEKAIAEQALRGQRLAELQYGPLSEFLKHMPPYIGAFKTGGSIPGGVNQAYTATVHGGETIVPAGGGSTYFNLHLHGDMANAVDSAMPGMVKEVDRRMGQTYRRIIYGPGAKR